MVDDEAVARFMSAAHCDAEQAQFFLEACGGNHDRALQMFLGGLPGADGGGGGGGSANRGCHERASSSCQHRVGPVCVTLAEQTAGVHDAHRAPHAPRGGGAAVQAYPAGAGGALPPPLALLGAVLGAPLALLGGGVRLLVRALGWGAALVGAVARRVLPARVTAALAGAGRALAASGEEVPPAQAAAEFARQFAGECCSNCETAQGGAPAEVPLTAWACGCQQHRHRVWAPTPPPPPPLTPPPPPPTTHHPPSERYGDRRPRWQECGWAEAASRAHSEAKFLFVYLHSPQHQVWQHLRHPACASLHPGSCARLCMVLHHTQREQPAVLLAAQVAGARVLAGAPLPRRFPRPPAPAMPPPPALASPHPGCQSHQVGVSQHHWTKQAVPSTYCSTCRLPVLQDTETFCRDTLCSPGLVEYVNQTFLCWGGDIQRSDAFRWGPAGVGSGRGAGSRPPCQPAQHASGWQGVPSL